MTLFRDGREILLLFLGRGHTGGDVEGVYELLDSNAEAQ